jgi:Cys-tRNA synthase (O-phospho-L-seryl-tRNA:Cys-tRNA synthase)
MRSSIELEKAIIDVLENTTQTSPIVVNDIADIVGITDSGSCPRTRKLILSAMKNNNIAIGSNRRGYFILRSEKEMQEYLNELMSRQIAISKRIEITYYAFHKLN